MTAEGRIPPSQFLGRMQMYIGSPAEGLAGSRESWEDSRATLHLTTEERVVWGPKATFGSAASASSLHSISNVQSLACAMAMTMGMMVLWHDWLQSDLSYMVQTVSQMHQA